MGIETIGGAGAVFKFIGFIVKGLLIIGILLTAAWFAIKIYFQSVGPIAPRVRADVMSRLDTQGSHFVTYDDIPQIYRSAVIATEDRRFNTNIGVDFNGVARAILIDVTHGKPLQGGSTITQQLVHNTILDNTTKSLVWKLKETIYAIGLYDSMSKKDIFSLYANDVYFGHGAYGLYSASTTYFGRVPNQLNAGELTLLAGLPNAPSDYDPLRNLRLARERQADVVRNMVENQFISTSMASRILAEPIRLRSS